MAHETAEARFVGLPLEVVGPVDLGRLVREVDLVDNALMQMELRKDGNEIKLPKTSQLLDKTIELNHLNMLDSEDRKQLQKFLVLIKAEAPVLHISFSADPSPMFVSKILTWLRQEIHPLLLLTVGMQPTIGAGCVVRTTNKYFDFSLRQDLLKKSDVLMAKLREVNSDRHAEQTETAEAPVSEMAAA